MYYTVIEISKYYFIASYRDAMPTNNRTHQTIQQNLIKSIKVQIDQEQSEFSEAL